MPTQTQTQRQEAARRGVATRKRHEADRARSAERAARLRAEAEVEGLKALSLRGRRALDTSLGAVIAAGERVQGALRPLVDGNERRQAASRAREAGGNALRDAERRGERARTHALRVAGREGRRLRREVGDRALGGSKAVRKRTSRVRRRAEQRASQASAR